MRGCGGRGECSLYCSHTASAGSSCCESLVTSAISPIFFKSPVCVFCVTEREKFWSIP